MDQTNPKRHKHAEIICAWANGMDIEFRVDDISGWISLVGPAPGWYEDYQYRIKPKLVKKWKWVIKDTNTTNTGNLRVTEFYYQSEEKFNSQNVYTGWIAIQKVDSTEIEVEET